MHKPTCQYQKVIVEEVCLSGYLIKEAQDRRFESERLTNFRIAILHNRAVRSFHTHISHNNELLSWLREIRTGITQPFMVYLNNKHLLKAGQKWSEHDLRRSCRPGKQASGVSHNFGDIR